MPRRLSKQPFKDVVMQSDGLLNRYRAAFESASTAMAVINVEGTIILANQAFERLSALPAGELEGTRTLTDFFADRYQGYGILAALFEGKCADKTEILEGRRFCFVDGNGREQYVSASFGRFPDAREMVISFHDYPDVVSRDERTGVSEEKYRSLIESTEDSVYMIDRDCRYVLVNERVLTRLDVSEKRIIGRSYRDFHDPQDSKEFATYVAKVFQTATSCRYEYRSKREERYTLRTLSPILKKESGEVGHVAIVSKDITDLKKTEEKLKFLSLHDSLTGLYNRAYFEEEMRRLDTGRFELAGIIVCDIDGLKLINDTLGHDKGDELLMAASKAIKTSFRESDVVARVGGDEFAILLPDSPRPKIEYICRRIKEAAGQYNRKNSLMPLSIATGFAIRNSPNQRMAELYREADNNMYKEKLYSSPSARNIIAKNLINAVEARCMVDGSSLRLFQELVAALARAAGLPEEKAKDLYLLAQFHDIGNISINDHILAKPGGLSDDEIREIEKHCDIGHRIAQSAPDLVHISDYILKHHEWWNGKGYPLGLKEHDIPMESRIIAIADAYQAMTSDRPHRAAMGKERALTELKRCAGTQFDPDLVEHFVRIVGNR